VTPFLFHGPLSLEVAIKKSNEFGVPVPISPMGQEGLKVDDSRVIIDLAFEGHIGDNPPTLVVGPVDDATVEASDALLKTLEDTVGISPLRIILWANSLGGVRETVTSRCNCVWCPGEYGSNSSGFVSSDPKSVQSLYEFILKDKQAEAIKVIRNSEENWVDLIRVVADHISSGISLEELSSTELPHALRFWRRSREILDGKGSHIVAIGYLFCQDTIEEYQ
jgi:hypothetical protein